MVLDLKAAQSYQVFPSGRTVIIKVMGGGNSDVSAGAENSPSAPARRPGLVVANYVRGASPVSVESRRTSHCSTFRIAMACWESGRIRPRCQKFCLRCSSVQALTFRLLPARRQKKLWPISRPGRHRKFWRGC